MLYHAKSLHLCLAFCDTVEPTRLLSPWHSPGKNTGVCCCALLQRSSQTRDGTRISDIGRLVLYH